MHSCVAKIPAEPADPEGLARNALHQGDVQGALTILMETYGDELFRHCLQVVGEPDTANDVHQTVFVQAYRDLSRFAGRSSFRTWLYAIARHRCLDALKMQRRRRRRFLPGLMATERPDPSPDAREQLGRHSEAAALDRALATLTPEVRIAVLLRYRENMSFEQMAEICNARPATLQARVARALPKLRKMLEKEEAGQ